MVKIYARHCQVWSIFGKSKFRRIEPIKDMQDVYELEYDGKTHQFIIQDPSMLEIDWNNTELINSLDVFNVLMDNELFNPDDNSIIIADRWVFGTLFVHPFNTYGVGFIKKLENHFKKKNIKVILANAYFEPLDYEDKHYTACNYNYDFDFIRFTDYPLFKDCKNTKYNTFYSLWNYIYDILSFEVSPNNGDMISQGKEVYYDWLENIVNDVDSRDKVFGMLGGKPRYHRLYFINEIIKRDMVDKSYLTMNRFFLEEYKNAIKDNNYFTDPTFQLKPDIKKYWNLDFYKEESFYKDIYDPLGMDKRFEYSSENIKNQEYNNSYIEIVAETHIIFDKLFDFWSEKTYHGIFFEKLFVSVGANRFYKEFEKLGGHTFIKELGINPNFLEEEDPIKQIDYVLEVLNDMTLDDVKKIYHDNLPKIKENKKIMLDWVYDNTNFLREYIINNL